MSTMSGFLKRVTTAMAAVAKSQTSDDPESSSESEEDDGVEESDRGPSPDARDYPIPSCTHEAEVIGSQCRMANTISAIYYSTMMCLLCVGTEEGTLYVHGYNHTWSRPRVGSEYSAIVSICGAVESKLIVLFEDGLLEILELPSLKVLDTLSSMYLGCLPGERLVSIVCG